MLPNDRTVFDAEADAPLKRTEPVNEQIFSGMFYGSNFLGVVLVVALSAHFEFAGLVGVVGYGSGRRAYYAAVGEHFHLFPGDSGKDASSNFRRVFYRWQPPKDSDRGVNIVLFAEGFRVGDFFNEVVVHDEDVPADDFEWGHVPKIFAPLRGK